MVPHFTQWSITFCLQFLLLLFHNIRTVVQIKKKLFRCYNKIMEINELV